MGLIEIKGGFKRSIKTYSVICSKCGKPFENLFPPKEGVPVYCPACMGKRNDVTKLEEELLKQDFSIEQEDEEIAKQIHEILEREKSTFNDGDENLITLLTKKMLKDEKRRKKIVKQILKLQKKKK